MTKPYQNNHKKFWLAGFFNTSKILQNKEKTYRRRRHSATPRPLFTSFETE